MADARLFIRKLRMAADALEDLFVAGNSRENPATARKVLGRPPKVQKPKPVHWTQRPENRAKVEALGRKLRARRRATP